MYFSTMVYPPLTTPPASDLQLKVLLYAVTPLNVWSFADLSAPYWRVYWNSNPGAWMETRTARFALDPDLATLVAPNTRYGTGLYAPVKHFYLHFTLQSSYAAIPPGVFQWAPGGVMMSMIGDMVERLESQRAGPYLDVLSCQLAGASLAQIPENAWPFRTVDMRVQAAMEQMSGNLQGKVNNSMLARMANMSTNAFIRLFTGQAGVSPQQYSLRARLDHACIMLHHTEKSIDEIADLCGFWDRNYFTRMFKKYRYMTPPAFRKQRIRYGKVAGYPVAGPTGLRADG